VAPPGTSVKICKWSGTEETSASPTSARAKLKNELLSAWSEAKGSLESPVLQRIKSGSRLGVILATTKSFVDDFIWNESLDEIHGDALTPLLRDFLNLADLQPTKQIVVSGACASSLSALDLAQQWLNQREVTEVLVLATDLVGPFVYRGFECLRVLAPNGGRPFSQDRSGFYLGEAAAAIVLSSHEGGGAFLRGVGVDAEGFAITRPSQSGESLKRACRSINGFQSPDLIIAHGTGTVVNDQIEDRVYTSLFPERPFITGTKWCVGHTLGASGAVDVIAACEALRTQTAFRLATTSEIDPEFQGRYLHASSDLRDLPPISRVMISSLGFGGIHAAALVELAPGKTGAGR
jgi:hypothetical protein